MLLALVSTIDSITTWPLVFRTAITIASLCTADILDVTTHLSCLLGGKIIRRQRSLSLKLECHCSANSPGLIRWCNLIIATGQNNLAMNRSVLQVAQRYVHGEKITHGMLNRVEAVIRAYEPCLSCSTHAVGQMALNIQLLSSDGNVLDEVRRS
jgi:hypothetical protein